MSKNPQVEEVKKWILEQRIHNRHSNLLYWFPMLSNGDDLGGHVAGALGRARAEDREEKSWLSPSCIQIDDEIGELDVTVGKRDAEELGRYGCMVLRRHKKRVVAMIPTWVIRFRDTRGLAPAQYGTWTVNQRVEASLNQWSRRMGQGSWRVGRYWE